jgi:hypothetical protein
LGKLKKKENGNFQDYNILSILLDLTVPQNTRLTSAYEVKDETSTSSTYVSLVFCRTVRFNKILVKI